MRLLCRRCWPRDAHRPWTPEQGRLPDGATSVRLCPGRPIIAYDGTVVGSGIQPPGDVLSTRIAELVDAVNDLDAPPRDTACPADGGPRLNYWFTYPDGDARAVTFELFGCDSLYVGSDGVRADGADVARLFAEALLEQREGVTAPDPELGSNPMCQGVMTEGGSALPTIPADLSTVTVCLLVGPQKAAPVPVPSELAARLEAALNTATPVTPVVTISRVTQRSSSRIVIGGRLIYSLEPCGLVYVRRVAGWTRDSELTLPLPQELLDEVYALPRETPVRLDSGITKVSPPVTPG